MLKKREEYSDEFIDLLYNDEDKERARNKTLLATNRVPFKCSVCGKPVERKVSMVYSNRHERMRTENIYCLECIPKNHSELEDEVFSELLNIYNGKIERNVRGILPLQPNSHTLKASN